MQNERDNEEWQHYDNYLEWRHECGYAVYLLVARLEPPEICPNCKKIEKDEYVD